MSKADLPPVPPAGRSDKGPGAATEGTATADTSRPPDRQADRNLAEQGRQGNIRQNTTHQGHQQDR